MDDRSLRALEFYLILERLSSFSISPLGQKRSKSLRPTRDRGFIETRLTEVTEFQELLKKGKDPPLQGLKDLEPILKRLEIEGAVLSVEEILELKDQLKRCRILRQFFLKQDVDAPTLREKVLRFSDLKSLEKEILEAIDPKGEILDKASPVLLEIRHRLEVVREKAKGVLESLLREEELQPIFQDHLITLRNGRYVLLIKSEFKHRLEGIIHDQSHTQKSLFFEPLRVVPLNNEISILLTEEKDEEYRIRKVISEKLRAKISSLWNDIEILGELDLLYAMARLSLHLQATKPKLNEKGKIELRKARNPILFLQDREKVVPIDLCLGERKKILILSGANGGGKTVALKTLGLLVLMVQSGLPLPVEEGSEITLFDEVFAVIGDEQSVEENLSSFSAHLLHVDGILKKSSPQTLVLIDELGVGTSAWEGCALAMGFLDEFREIGATVVITTHFDGLKTYGYLYPEVENVKVDFDEVTLEPRYTLLYGAIGMSNAFLVAEKLGISQKILQRAKAYREGGDEKISKALDTLDRLKGQVEAEKIKLQIMKEEVERTRQRLKESLEQIKKKRVEILSRVEAKARKLAQEVEEELKAWLKEQKENKPLSSIRRMEIQEIKARYFPSVREKGPPGSPLNLKSGDRVWIEGLRKEGTILNILYQSNRVEVLIDQARVILPLSDLKRIDEEKKTSSGSKPLFESNQTVVPSKLNVIGLRVEEALPVVDKFIDQALYHGLEKVQIIHGIGSGRLRTAIGKYLESHRGVKQFGPGDLSQGGHGITVVELR
ncbi:MAG: endonuclease MutS2 [Thermodesulfobacteriota bacterium]